MTDTLDVVPRIARDRQAMELIPGERDGGILTHGPSSSFGGPAAGRPPIPEEPSTMDAVMIAERQKEGGGAASQRRPRGKVGNGTAWGRRMHELWRRSCALPAGSIS